MKNNILRTATVVISLLLVSLLMFSGCFGNIYDDYSEEHSDITISHEAEGDLPAGPRLEIKYSKNVSNSLYNEDYVWSVVGENTVGLTFESEDVDTGDSYHNMFVRAQLPGTVKIQVVNNSPYYGQFSSNILELTFTASSVNTVDELKALANSEMSCVLGANIDLSGEENWTPIENYKGTLIGNGYTISNLKISSTNTENLGLFATLEGGAKDVIIENASISARGDIGRAGILAGTNKGVISGVSVTGNVDVKYYKNVGGIIGYNDGGIIKDCTSEATVNGAENVGGIVGSMIVDENEAIVGCTNEGLVNGKNNVGGVAGYISMVPMVDADATYTVSDNKNANTVTGDNNVGGVFGNVDGISNKPDWKDERYGYFNISLLENTGEVLGNVNGENAGGIIGKATRLVTLAMCENKANVTGGFCVGGQVGNAPSANIKANDIENTFTITGKGKVGGFAGHAGVIEYAINTGDIISNGVLVEDGKSRAYVGGIAGYCEGVVGCINNVDITVQTNGSYVGGIAGYILISDNDKANANVNNGEIRGADHVGGIAGYITTVSIKEEKTYTVSNNENKGNVSGGECVGGIFGEVYASYYDYYGKYYSHFEMSTLVNNGEINGDTSKNYTGGLIGKSERLKTITTCQNNANVSGGRYVGGFVGYSTDINIKATGATNSSIITGQCYVGGFAGQAGIIESAINEGEVIALGKTENGETFLGGIAGYCTGAIGCTNNHDIEMADAGYYVGGIAGYIMVSEDNTIRDNVNNAVVSANNKVGGIAGHIGVAQLKQNLTFTSSNNSNNGSINGDNTVGGIFGEVCGDKSSGYTIYYSVINCTNNGEVTGSYAVGGIMGGCTYTKTDSNILNTNTTNFGDIVGSIYN